MFAIIKTGGKQYRVAKDDVIKVEKLAGAAGDQLTLGEVLAYGSGDDVTVGAPFVSGASVLAEVVEQARGPKILWFKKRRRQNSKRKGGHRQDLTVLKVLDITTGGDKPAKKSKAKAKAEDAPAEASAEA